MRRRHKLRGVESPNAKLTEEQVIEMRRLYDTHEYGSFKKLSDEFGVSQIVARTICMQITWRHLTPERKPVEPMRYPRAVRPEVRQLICSLYVNGKGMAQIHEITSVSVGTISKIVNEEGCKAGYDKRFRSGCRPKFDYMGQVREKGKC